MTTFSEVEKWVGKVADGKITTSSYLKLQAQRHIRDKDKAKDHGWVFDVKEAEKHMYFLKNVVRHSSDRWAGKQFQAQPFQLFMIASLFGWMAPNSDTGGLSRRFTTLLFDIARKNGKTETAAGLSNDFFVNSGFGTEIYFAATKREQAMKTFKSTSAQMLFMMRHSAHLRRLVERRKYSMEIPSRESYMMPVSSDHNSLDGLNPLVAIIDEYHAHRTADVLNVMETGQGARWDGPLLMVTTTAGFDKTTPCYDFRTNAIEVLKGNLTDDRLLPFIFAMDEGDDWENPDNWYKSNPNIGVSVSSEWLKGQFQKAKNEGASKTRQFQVKNLNWWVDADDVWIERAVWKANAKLSRDKIDILLGKKCYGGLDLSSVKDMTSFCLVFPVQAGLDQPHVLSWHFIPEKRARELGKKGFKHMDWIKDGWLSATKRPTVDEEAVKNTIMMAARKYVIKDIAYDRWGSKNITESLGGHVRFEPFGQGFGDMNEPSKSFETAVHSDTIRIEHFNDPVLYWQIGNTIVKTDPAGNIKPDKEKATRQIDGIVAMIMAWGRMNASESRKSPYESRGIIVT